MVFKPGWEGTNRFISFEAHIVTNQLLGDLNPDPLIEIHWVYLTKANRRWHQIKENPTGNGESRR